ncbi:MAG: DEAD/DEAH box helicase [Candidatus Aenigmarchaeota archaeon]|nr:DEAD/DEAH box helicase [Candidatus Aenigmarchaeota archaeon]
MVQVKGMEPRDYQQRILQTLRGRNTLVCLPTGLGKTNIAILLAAERLQAFPGSQALVLAPTKPLAAQHLQAFRAFLDLPPEAFALITGAIPPKARKEQYRATIIFATPQTVQKDLEAGRVSLDRVSLLVIDELHHGVGKYPYPAIAQRYLATAGNARVLGLTASPGSNREKIKDICRNAGIDAVEIATEADPDVRPYVKDRSVAWVEVELPDAFLAVRAFMDEAYKRRTRRLGVKTRKQLLWLQQQLQGRIRAGNRGAFALASLVSQAIKLEHAVGLLETQSIGSVYRYFQRLQEDQTRAAKILLADRDIVRALALLADLHAQGARHPKMGKLCALLQQQFQDRPGSRVIVFANYRDMVREVAEVVSRLEGCRPAVLIGQKEGITQKKQLAVLQAYRDGAANCLITTSIGEEGLHLEEADLAIFYEAVPSEIRSIQRRGRVGRGRAGAVMMLVTKGTRDEAFRWSAARKERSMRSALEGFQKKERMDDTDLARYLSKKRNLYK